MSADQEKRENGKRPYQKPTLRTIELAAEEVLAVGCKITTAAGPVNPASCVFPSSCYSIGS